MNLFKNLLFGNKINELLKHGIEHSSDQNYFTAITFFSQVLNIDKNNVDAFWHRGNAYLEVKHYEKAIADLKEVERINSKFNPVLYKLISKIYFNLGNSKDFLEYSKLYYKDNSEDAQAIYQLARALYFNKNYDESLKYTDLLIAEGNEDFYIRYLRSLNLFDQSNFVSSLLEIDKAIENDTLNCFAFNLRGLINIQLYNFSEAIEDFDYAIRLNPTNQIYYFNKAKLQLKIGDLLDARTSIENCIDLDPVNKNAHLLKAQVELFSENYSDVLDSYKKISEIDPEDIPVKKAIFSLSNYLKEFNTSRNYIDDILKRDPNDEDALINLSYSYFKEGNSIEAISAINSAVENNITEAEYQKSVFLFNDKNFEETIKICDEIISKDKNNPVPRLLKSKALLKMGRLLEAEKELEDISGIEMGREYYLLKSLVHFLKNEPESAYELLNKNLKEEANDITMKILFNLLKTESRRFEETEDLNEFQLKGKYKNIVQILNAVLNFEKDQFHSAKYRLTNLKDISIEQKEAIIDFIEYSDSRI